jgi:integrase
MVGSYLLQQAERRSNNAHNKERKNLLAQWNWGLKRELVKHNPVAKIERLPHDREKQYTPPEQDVKKVLEVARQEEIAFLYCYLHTAARRAEIFRWKWADDIDFKHRQVRLGTRKTKDGSMKYRWLPMADELHDTLMWLWENREFPDSEHAFVNTHPGPYYGKPFKARRRFLAGLCDRAKVKPFGFHAIRRFVAIQHVENGASLKSVQRLLGHENMATTEKYLERENIDLQETLNKVSFGNGFLHERVKNEQGASLHGSA